VTIHGESELPTEPPPTTRVWRVTTGASPLRPALVSSAVLVRAFSVVLAFRLVAFPPFAAASEAVDEGRVPPQRTATITAPEGSAGRASRRDGCATRMIDFVQITSGRLDAGEQTFEAFRVLRNGRIESARWTSSGLLLDHAQLREPGSKMFDRVLSSPSVLNPSAAPRDDAALKRPAFRLEVAAFSGATVRVFLSMAEMPDDLARLTDEIRQRQVATPVAPGWYLWTKPYPTSGSADIDLTASKCDSAVDRALSGAVETGSLVVRVSESVCAFISGERASRVEFSARIVGGDLHFGVISAQ
jgi:hypothetical protein